jgi:hypothetical protein
VITAAFKTLWFVLMLAAVVWYSTITVYVAIRGALDIKHMLRRLRDENLSATDNGA